MGTGRGPPSQAIRPSTPLSKRMASLARSRRTDVAMASRVSILAVWRSVRPIVWAALAPVHTRATDGRCLGQTRDGARRHGDVARVRDSDPRAEPDARGSERAGGQRDPQLAAHQVGIGDPGRVVTERLGQLYLPHDRGNRLAPEDADVELHAVPPSGGQTSTPGQFFLGRARGRPEMFDSPGLTSGSTRLARVSPMWESLGMRRAADYVTSLRDGRAVFLDGQRVADVTSHPAFAEAIRRIAERYEAAHQAPEVTECVD